MKKLIPQNDCVLCTLETKMEKTTPSGFVYKSNDVPVYKVVSFGPLFKNEIGLNVGDMIRTNSSGTLAKAGDCEYYIFKEENIAAKIIEG